MSVNHPPIDGARAMKLGTCAVAMFRRTTGGRLRDVVDLWSDDIAQEVAILILARGCGGTGLRYAVVGALRTIFGQKGERHRPGAGDTFAAVIRSAPDGRRVDSACSPARDECGVLALWRLQRLWPTLTEVQRTAVMTELTDGPYESHTHAYVKTVASRINSPGAIRRAVDDARGAVRGGRRRRSDDEAPRGAGRGGR